MRTVYKYELALIDYQQIAAPEGAIARSVMLQQGVPTLWAEVDTRLEVEAMHIITIGTGQPMPEEPCTFIGTYQLLEGELIFHVYQAIPNRIH